MPLPCEKRQAVIRNDLRTCVRECSIESRLELETTNNQVRNEKIENLIASEDCARYVI